jgi:death-on-curing protein
LTDWTYLDLPDFLLIAESVLRLDAERLAEMPRVIQMAESALAVPASGFGGVEAYPDFVQKAGLLASRLARDHPLPDGNKRVAWLAMIEFIERNGFGFAQPDVDEAVRTMFALAAGEMPESDFIEWLRPRITAPSPHTG